MYQKTLVNFLSLFVLLLAAHSILTPVICAQDEPALLIEIYDSNDWNQSAGTIVFEGRTYDITVSTENETVVLGVNVTLLGKTYLTSLTEPFITIVAPGFDTYDSFVITATKEGYQSDTLEITVLKGELSIFADRGTIEEQKQFQVSVKDQDNMPVEGALVYVTEDAEPILTDYQGIAYVEAPEVEIMTTFTIQVIKNGYLPGSTTIRIENVEASFFFLTESKFLQILPVLLAVLVVILSIVYVLVRQKKSPHMTHRNKQVESSEELPSYPQGKTGRSFKKEPTIVTAKEKRDISAPSPEARVEEIRIPVQAKKKETTVLSEEKEPEPVPVDQEKQKDEWFKGQDYMRYKIDEMTGKIDQKTDGKWFEGEFDSKYKIDETLKKNLKKKKPDQEDNN